MNIFHYALILIFFLLLGSVSSKSNNFKFSLGTVAIFLYSALVAFKGEAGSDTYVYYQAYLNFSDSYLSFKNYSGFREPGFWFLNYLSSKANFDFSFLNFLNSIVIFFSLLLSLKKIGAISLLIYIPFVGLNVDFSTMRFSFALHVFVILYFYSGRVFLSAFFSGLFHSFGFLFFIPVVFKEYDFYKIKWYEFLGGGGMLLVGLLYMYNEFVERYINEGEQFIFRDGAGFMFQTALIFAICIISRLKRRDSFMILFLSIVPVGFRVAGVFILLSTFRTPRKLINVIVLYFLVFFLYFAKLYSFSIASFQIDGSRSVITHYGVFFK